MIYLGVRQEVKLLSNNVCKLNSVFLYIGLTGMTDFNQKLFVAILKIQKGKIPVFQSFSNFLETICTIALE